MALTKRDKAIIFSVYENRFLRRDQIQKLYFAGKSLPACNMRLKKLYENRFLERIIRPVAYGSSQAVYALDKNGVQVVAKLVKKEPYQIDWNRDKNKVRFLFLDHTLQIAEFKVNLNISLKNPETNLIFYQRESKSLKRKVLDPRGIKKYLVVMPDAFFGLQNDKGKYYFFLEVDMGTETLKRFQEKVIAYKEYWKSGKYLKDYGFNHFRVLTIAKSEKRILNLLLASQKKGAKNMFLFTTFSAIENKGMFYPIWISPVSDKPINILE